MNPSISATRALLALAFSVALLSAHAPVEGADAEGIADDAVNAWGLAGPAADPDSLGPGAIAFEQSGVCCPNCRDTRVYRSVVLGRFWMDAEYLGWATKSERLPALVTTSPAGALPGDTGVLGLPGTETLFGGQHVFGEMRSGMRLTGGFWWTPAQSGGIEASFIGLDHARRERLFDSTAEPLLARPFFDVNAGQEASRLVAYPGILTGSIAISASSSFSGAEVLLRQSIGGEGLRRVYLVGGYRFAHLADSIQTGEVLQSLDAQSGYDPGTDILRLDRFDAISDFHGGEAGLVARWWRDRFSLEVQGKLAIGATANRVRIDGATITETVVGGNPLVTEFDGGVLALPTNMGRYRSGRFAAIGEMGVSMDYALTCNLRASLGYNFMYWSRVARVADQIDRTINPTQFPPGAPAGPARPEFALRTTDFWAQGLSLGLEYQF